MKDVGRLSWSCVEYPAWMTRVETGEDIDRQEDLFYFITHVPVDVDKVEGIVRFECNDLVKNITFMSERDEVPVIGLS